MKRLSLFIVELYESPHIIIKLWSLTCSADGKALKGFDMVESYYILNVGHLTRMVNVATFL